MRRFLSFFLASLCVAVGLGETPGSRSPSDLRDLLNQSVPGWLKEYDVPSVAIAYVLNGKVAWTAVYGEQSPGVPATDRTLYNVASLTKPITAEVILRLASQGKISLDEPLYDSWVDPDVKDDPRARLLTARLCLSHQTGFTNWRYQTNNVLKFQWEPGTRTGYSGEGYNYVARFAEKKTGQPFEELAKEYVFDPLGMHDTSFTTRDWYEGRQAMGRGPKGEIVPKAATQYSAADLLRTTVGDYAKFVVSVMHDQGLTRSIATQRLTMTRDLVTAKDKEELCPLTKSATANCQLATGMGLGWQVIHVDGETIVDHTGSDPGMHSVAFFVPKRGVGAVLFTNGDNGPKLMQRIAEVLYPDPPFIATLKN